LAALAAGGWAVRSPQTSTEVTWLPAAPRQGWVVRIVVHPDTGRAAVAELWGRTAGQPLHFERGPNGGFHAFAPIPVDAEGSLGVSLTVRHADGEVRRLRRQIPVAAAHFTMEQLEVAPRFVEPPDSALQARIDREFAQAFEVSRSSHRTPRLWNRRFIRPVDGRVTSEFGQGREFNERIQSRHMGVDLSGVTGTPIRAAGRGVVALIGDFYYAGNVVYLDHGRGLVTAYLHMSEVAVARGDTVEQGTLLGRVGATGRVTGPHLHWIARYGTVSFDGLALLTLDPPPFDAAPRPAAEP
jgi:hypothetical protein